MNRYRSLKLPSSGWRGALASALLATAAHADNTDWQLHGVLTQGAVYTSDNNFYGSSDDDVSLKFTEISFNASARLHPNVRAAGQILYRQAGAQGEGGEVDYAFIDYKFSSDSTTSAGIRAGRYKLPIGLYNETRDIAFTRPSIYAPQSAYPDRARDLELSGDGALFYSDIFTDSGQWTLELYGGRPRVDKDTLDYAFTYIPGDVDHLGSRDVFGGRAMYQSGDGAWLVALSRAEANLHYHQALLPTLETAVDLSFTYWIASLQYNFNQWTFTSEYGHMDIQLDSDLFDSGLHPLFYYAQVTRRLNQQWSIYTRYDNLYWDRRDRSGDDYSALTGADDFANFSHDYGLGVRYDINNSAMIRAEYHYIDGAAWLSGLENSSPARYWDMLALEFSYRF